MFSQQNVLYPKAAISGTTPVGSTALTVSNAAVGTTAYVGYTEGGTALPKVQLITFDVQSAPVNARWDGTNPTAAAGGGHLLPQGGAYTWAISQFNAAKFIRTGSTDAVLFISAMMC